MATTKLNKKARVSRAKTAAEARWGNTPRFRKQVALSTTRPKGIEDLWEAMAIRAKNREQDIGELAFEILYDALEGTIETIKHTRGEYAKTSDYVTGGSGILGNTGT